MERLTISKPVDSLELARYCAGIADQKRGTNISILEVRDLIRITDYFVIVTATNRPQAQAMADEIEKKAGELSRRGHKEGYSSGYWVLLDFGDVVVHILREEARAHYDLDNLWADAPRISPPPTEQRDPQAKAV